MATSTTPYAVCIMLMMMMMIEMCVCVCMFMIGRRIKELCTNALARNYTSIAAAVTAAAVSFDFLLGLAARP